MKTLKEYEEQKAIEKQKKAEKAILSVPQARALDKDLESMLVLSKEKTDDIYTKQVATNEVSSFTSCDLYSIAALKLISCVVSQRNPRINLSRKKAILTRM